MTEHVKVEIAAGVMTLTLQRPEKKNALCDELTAAGVDWQFISYSDTGHGFTADNIPMNADKSFGFQPDTNRRSWKAMTDFLTEALG